jgi:hypothetical protein
MVRTDCLHQALDKARRRDISDPGTGMDILFGAFGNFHNQREIHLHSSARLVRWFSVINIIAFSSHDLAAANDAAHDGKAQNE